MSQTNIEKNNLLNFTKILGNKYTITYKDKTLDFKYSQDIDPAKVGELLGIEAKEVLKLRHRIRDDELQGEISLSQLTEILGITIRHDEANALITFFGMLTCYTEEDQLNIQFRAPSSTGKTFIPLEIKEYFPSEDLLIIAWASPSAFWHEIGEWDDERKLIIVNLERKIIIFLDMPHDQLVQRLRPLLSHDQKELEYRITDKKEVKGLRTKHVHLIGFPSTVFCTGSLKIDEQEQTRNFILSPEMSEEKIRESIYLKALKKSDPLAYQEILKSHPEIETLKARIREIKKANIKNIFVKDYDKVVKKFLQKYPKLKSRHMRDISMVISLIKASALLNFYQREKDHDNNIYANETDIDNGFEIFTKISESQDLGIAPYIYLIYQKCIIPLWKRNQEQNQNQPSGIQDKEISAKHYELFGKMLDVEQLRKEILPAIESTGLIYREKDPNDQRSKLVYLTPTLPKEQKTLDKI